jgi:hypothetical protein
LVYVPVWRIFVLVPKGIAPHIPVLEKALRDDGRVSSERQAANLYKDGIVELPVMADCVDKVEIFGV